MQLVLHVGRGDGTVATVAVSPVTAAVPDIVPVAASAVTCVAVDPADPGRVYAGTFDHGLFRSDDAGATWTSIDRGIPHARVTSVAVSVADPGTVYAGTEPSSVYRSRDGGASWDDLAALRDLPSAPTWSFPPRPETHHVRWIAPDDHEPGLVFVGIELGGVLRSTDGGETFEDRHVDSVIDPHVLRVHPRVPARAYAVGGDGVAYSTDRGEHWTRHWGGMDRAYSWGLAVDAVDPDLWYVSAAQGPAEAHGRTGHAGARLYRTRGDDWEALQMYGADLLDAMPYGLLAPGPDLVIALLDDGTLHGSDDAGTTWERLAAGLDDPLALTGYAKA